MKHLFSDRDERWNGFLLILFVLLVVLVFGLMRRGWGKSENDPYRILIVPKVVDEENDFWKALIEGAEAAAKEYGVELTIKAADAEDNHKMQAEILRQAAEEHPDAVVLAPTSYTEVTESAKEVTEAGIPLILVDSNLDENISTSIIATDNLEAGEKMAEVMKEILPENPVIGIVAHVQGSSTAMEREAGFRQGLKEYEDCIVGTVFSNSDYDKGYEVTMELLEQYPDINVLAGLNEYSAVGAARAVMSKGLSGKIRMVGFDSSTEEIQLLESGVFQGIVVQKPFNMGYLSVETAVQVLQGKAVEKSINSGSQAVTKDTMYTEENQKLLFLFRE
ncbi:MAG: substrate-binding domain-containing protein [Candidatus Choladocola sp.]|nr:substrate-binding domain-containing protein [Candidatus Choladocola sp.]